MVGSSMVMTGSGAGFSTSVMVSPMLMPVDAGDRDDVAQLGGDDVGALQSGEGEQLGDLDLLQRAVALGDGDVFAGAQRAVEDARDRQAAEIVAVIEVGDQHLQRPVGIALAAAGMVSTMASNSGRKFSPGLFDVGRRRARLGVGVEHGKVELVFAGVEIDEQVVDLVQHFLRARVGAVDLVDDQDRRQLGFQRLAQHVARLRQRAFAGVHQQHHAVHHLQRALHFAAEIAVAGRVDDVDLDVVDARMKMAVFLARMVMPRSRSSSLESITRSTCASLARKVPLWFSMASTSVVLPWSTWAMMAMLRILVLKTHVLSA